jgi:hypothetical protein
MTTKMFDSCPNCGSKTGQLHRIGCDVEPCPRCGRQLLSCIHYLFGSVQAPPDEERIPWSGEWPGERECREFGWCVKSNPTGPGYVPCGPDDPEAQPDLNRLHKETVWDRRQKQFLRKEDLGGLRLVLHWFHEHLTPEAKTIGEMIDALQEALDELRRMRELGVVLSEESDMEGGHAVLVTTEPVIAKEFDFELELERGGEGDGEH